MAKLNAARLKVLTTVGAHCDGGGLYLQVRGPTRRSWVFRYARGGRGHLMGLGPFPDVSLAEARELAENARRMLRAGDDPILAKRALRKSVSMQTFADVAHATVAAHEAGWRSQQHKTEWIGSLDRYAFPVIGKMPVSDVKVGDVLAILEPIWRTKSETASRLRGRIESVLDYAAAHGWRGTDNPARWRGHLENLLPAVGKMRPVRHHPAMAWNKIGGFVAQLRQQDCMEARALEFVILTAARAGEVLWLRWSEIDMSGAVWVIPAERMKAGKQHRVPLSPAARAILRDVADLRTDAADLVFPGAKGRPLPSQAMLAVLRGLGHPDLAVHGFRSTFRQWCAEQTEYPREVAEAALAHAARDRVESAYQRSDLLSRRAVLMAEWSAFCGKVN